MRRDVAGPLSEVAVLGTVHLAQEAMPADYDNRYLGPLLDHLAEWRPQIITIEAIPGPECDDLRRYQAINGSVERYCRDLTEVQSAVGLDTAGATLAVTRALESWPAAPSAAERRHLAALFLAAGDAASAEVQWLRLSSAEQQPADGLTAKTTAILREGATRRDESYSIAVRLAVRLGLDRVYAPR